MMCFPNRLDFAFFEGVDVTGSFSKMVHEGCGWLMFLFVEIGSSSEKSAR